MATNTITILPKDLQAGMRAEFHVTEGVGYEDTYQQFCEVLSVSKKRRNGATVYSVRIAEAVNGVPTRVESTRFLQPRRHVIIEKGGD